MEEEEEEDRDVYVEDAYDRWRDDWGEQLDHALTELYTKFVKSKHGYYTDRPERLKEHIISYFEAI